jgi:hypothetical protein
MASREDILELLAHYALMIVIMFAVLAAIEAFYGDLDFLVSLGVAVIVALAYSIGVRRLGVAPAAWQRGEN